MCGSFYRPGLEKIRSLTALTLHGLALLIVSTKKYFSRIFFTLELKKKKKISFLNFVYVSMGSVHMRIDTCGGQKRALGLQVGKGPLYGLWELNSGPLQGQYPLVTSELSHQLLDLLYGNVHSGSLSSQ